MKDLTSGIKDTVSISDFNKGLAGKIFDDVKVNGAKIVMKNNKPECILISPEDYVAFMEEIEDARLATEAYNRLSKHDLSDAISEEEMLKRLNINPKDLK